MRIFLGRASLLAFSLLVDCSSAPSSRGPEFAMPPVPVQPFDAAHTIASKHRSPSSSPGITVVQAVGGVAETGVVTLTPAIPHQGDLPLIFGAVGRAKVAPTPAPLSPPSITPSPTGQPAVPRRAMWVWGTPDDRKLIDFAQRNSVQELFYSVSSHIGSSELARIRTLKTLADAAGITLDALGGDPTWATTNTQDALAWETSALKTGLFAGAHFDIEPAALPAWKSDNAATIVSYLWALDRIRANSSAHFEVDVPFWYGRYQATGYRSLADAVISKTDETTTMSYRNTATGRNSLFGVGQDMLARAEAAGKPTRLGAETNSVQPPNVTFYTVGNAAMLAALPRVDAAAAAYASYRGIAIEDYVGWKNLGGAGP